MHEREPERLRGLTRQGSTTVIHNGPGKHHRQFDSRSLSCVFHGHDRRFGIERIKNGFDQQKIDPAVDQPADLLLVGGRQLIER